MKVHFALSIFLEEFMFARLLPSWFCAASKVRLLMLHCVACIYSFQTVFIVYLLCFAEFDGGFNSDDVMTNKSINKRRTYGVVYFLEGVTG